MRPRRLPPRPVPASPPPLRIRSGVFDVDGVGCEGSPPLDNGAGDGCPTAASDAARLLVRVVGEPVGFVEVPLDDGRLDQRFVWDSVQRELGTAIARKLHECGSPQGGLRQGEGASPRGRARTKAASPSTRRKVTMALPPPYPGG